MAQTVRLKRSATQGAAPSTSDLALGEVAINTYDGKVYIKKDDGTASIVEVGGAASGAYTKYAYTATASQTTFSVSYAPGYVDVWLNGVKLDTSDYTATSGSSIVLASAATSGDLFEAIAWNIANIQQNAYTKYSYTATASQTTFTASYTQGYVNVYLNGVLLLDSTEYTATNGTSVVLATGAAAGDSVVIEAFSTYSTATPTFTGTVTADGLSLGDNEKAQFGNSNDLQIYHDGSNSYVQDAGSGNLYLRQNGTAVIIDDGTNNLAAFNSVSGESSLYYGGSGKKLATTATGIDVTGTATMDRLTVTGTTDSTEELARFGNSTGTQELIIEQQGTTGYAIKSSVDLRLHADYNSDSSDGGSNIEMYTDGTQRMSITGSTGDISFYEDTGTTPKFFWDASAESLGIGNTSPIAALDVTGTDSTGSLTSLGDTVTRAAAVIRGSTHSNGYGLYMGYGNATTNAQYIQATRASGQFAYPLLLNPYGGNVGIGTTSPAYLIDAQTASGNAQLHLKSGGDLAQIILTSTSTTGTSQINFADADSANIGMLQYFHSDNHMEFTVNSAERMRIDSSGNLLVGTTSVPSTLATTGSVAGFGFDGASDYLAISRTSASPLILNRLTNDGDIISFRRNGSVVGSIGSNFGVDIHLGTGNTRLRFVDVGDYIRPASSDGGSRDGLTDLGASNHRFKDLYLSGGVYLGGTTSANKLDDYETGTWTPTVVGVTTAGTGTYTTQEGIYTKVGNLVTVSVYLVWTAHTGTGTFTVAGLPFNFTSSDIQVGSVYATDFNAGTSATCLMAIGNNSGAIQFRGFVNNSTRTVPTVGDNTAATLCVTFSYRVA